MQIKEIKNFCDEKKLPSYQLKQIIKAVYCDGVSSFSEITTISKKIREELEDEYEILPFEVEKVEVSAQKDSHKALLKLKDGNLIETVLLNSFADNWSTCISSQAGCAMGCKFCATGGNGFFRNLTREEIVDQVLFWKQYLRKNKMDGFLTNVVFMGMGEPFMNYENVKKSIDFLTDKDFFNLSNRHVSVSTCGLVEGIKKFANDFPQINLAVSLVTANDKKRSELMPINTKFNISDIQKALNYYFKRANRKIFLEYIMFKDINDDKKDANDLINFIQNNDRPDLLHVNLISYNKTESEFSPSSKERVVWFKNFLQKNRIQTTIRKSLGSEINGACGQLSSINN